MKYVLEKELILKPGPHNIFLGLPQESFFVEVQSVLPDQRRQVLEFKPIYAHSSRHRMGFLYGVVDYEVYLNGERVR